ncbi:hypothetical protein Tco_0748529 [Tanacetum coccineum]|uniref:Uncharacterized protein n=1 Tax=Tanacetum coccineum TaxID=301880 RepID=A0ABQ4YVY9_9ASTR
MSVGELVAWAEEEINSPYLRSPPLKCRPFRNDTNGKGMNDAAKILDGMSDDVEGRMKCIEGMNDAANSVEFNEAVDFIIECIKGLKDGANSPSIDEHVLARQKKLDKDNESDSNENADEYGHMFSESETDESNKSFDYLSNGEDEVIELRKRRIQFKSTGDEVADEEGAIKVEQGTRPDVDKNGDVDDNGLG